MIGAIIGDIIGSRFEFNNTRDYDFELFDKQCSFTDDTICTVAVADAIMSEQPYKEKILEWCRRYPHPMGGYGGKFAQWVASDNPEPYNSFGNGAAMRVSPIGWAFKDKDVFSEAKKSAECSHSHEEGIKGAQTTALCTHLLARKNWKSAKMMVSVLLSKTYGSDYITHLPNKGEWNETCQGCVPLAIHIFLHSVSFEDAIRSAISYGGDSDTLGAIVGSLAGAYYEIPRKIEKKAMSYLPKDMLDVVERFKQKYM